MITNKLTPQQRLADAIHNKFCDCGKSNDCPYVKETWDAPGAFKAPYFNKAVAMLHITTYKNAMDILKIIKS